MQMVKKILIGLALLWLFLLFFMPKQEMYYKLENILAKSDIKMNEERINAGLFTLTVHQADIYVKGIKLAKIEKLEFFTLLFYTTVKIDNLTLDETLKNMAPTQIDTATISHALWSPIKSDIVAQGSFGKTTGTVNLKEKRLHLDFNSTKGVEMLKSKLQKDEKGWYYETSF